jgi:hypothetical protein
MFRVSQQPLSGVSKTVTATSGVGLNPGTATSFQRGLIGTADKWQGIWPIITQSIDYKLTNEMENQYNNLNRKLDKVQREKCPDQATLEGSSCTRIMTYTRGCGYNFWNS